MKKILLLALALGIYSLPSSASDVDSDYSESHEYLSAPDNTVTNSQKNTNQALELDITNQRSAKANSQSYKDDTPWVGATYQCKSNQATHRFPFDEFGYDEE